MFFYGAGCANKEKCKVLESSLVAQFKTPVTVMSDLLGAARGLLVREPGLACIIGTGSNSCLYDGEEVVRNVSPLGFILGDEGSGAYMGKIFVADVLKGLAPSELTEAFYEHFNVSHNLLMDDVYTNSLPNRALARYASFLTGHVDEPYVHDLVYDAFMLFFKRNIIAYDYRSYPINFVGSVAVNFRDILLKALGDFGAAVGKITRYSMPGLIEYHKND